MDDYLKKRTIFAINLQSYSTIFLQILHGLIHLDLTHVIILIYRMLLAEWAASLLSQCPLPH